MSKGGVMPTSNLLSGTAKGGSYYIPDYVPNVFPLASVSSSDSNDNESTGILGSDLAAGRRASFFNDPVVDTYAAGIKRRK